MDNREFAKVLLSEATELLNEDARARHTDRKVEAARKEYARQQKLVSHGKDPSVLDNFKNNKVRLTSVKDGKYAGDFVDINPVTSDEDYKTYKNARKGRIDVYRGFHGSEAKFAGIRGNGTVREPAPDKNSYENIEPFYNSALKKAGLTDKDKYSRNEEIRNKYDKALKDGEKTYKLHKRISERGSQNECAGLAALLTEAALLLNESGKK